MSASSIISLSCYIVSSAAMLLCECANGSITHGSFVSADDALHRLLPFLLSLFMYTQVFVFSLSSLTPSIPFFYVIQSTAANSSAGAILLSFFL